MNSSQHISEAAESGHFRITSADRMKIKEILTATISSLCKNSLVFDSQIRIEGLLGVTVDKKDILLISICEVINNPSKNGEQTTSRSSTDAETSSNVSQIMSSNEEFIKPCKQSYDNKRSSITNSDESRNSSQFGYEVNQNTGEQRRFNAKKRKTESANSTFSDTGNGATEASTQSYKRQYNGVKIEAAQSFSDKQYGMDQNLVKVKSENFDDRVSDQPDTLGYRRRETNQPLTTDIYEQPENYVGYVDEQEYVGDESCVDESEGEPYLLNEGGYHSAVAAGLSFGSTSKKSSGFGSSGAGFRQPWKRSRNPSRKFAPIKKSSVNTETSSASNISAPLPLQGNWLASAGAPGTKDSNQTMIQRALNLVREGQLSASTAISIFGIARSTFYKKLADLTKSEGAIATDRDGAGWASGEGSEWRESGDIVEMNGDMNTLGYDTFTEY